MAGRGSLYCVIGLGTRLRQRCWLLSVPVRADSGWTRVARLIGRAHALTTARQSNKGGSTGRRRPCLPTRLQFQAFSRNLRRQNVFGSVFKTRRVPISTEIFRSRVPQRCCAGYGRIATPLGGTDGVLHGPEPAHEAQVTVEALTKIFLAGVIGLGGHRFGNRGDDV